MVEENDLEYIPDYASPPGDTLLETIGAIGMTQSELAMRTGRPAKTINEIIQGKAAITAETALQLERVLGIPASFWNNRQKQYDETLARINEKERLINNISWVRNFNIRELIKRKWIPELKEDVDLFQALLDYFGVNSPREWQRVWEKAQAYFRQSTAFDIDMCALAAWLRKGELKLREIECGDYDADRFRETLQTIRALTVKPPEVFQPKTIELCANVGVALAFVPELPEIRLSGATRWIGHTPLIMLTLRYKTDDQLWFTFFHEAAHILLHGKKEIFLDVEIGKIDKQEEEKERRADKFAADLLISTIDYAELVRYAELVQIRQANWSKAILQNFAHRIELAPGIVVGRLQHDNLLPQNWCNGLKKKLRWANN